MVDWSTFGISSVSMLAVAGVLFKIWIKTRLSESIKSEYRILEQEQQAKHAQELEGWKAGYQKALGEHQIKFAKLHEERAEAIKSLYVMIVDLHGRLVRLSKFDFSNDVINGIDSLADASKLYEASADVFAKCCGF